MFLLPGKLRQFWWRTSFITFLMSSETILWEKVGQMHNFSVSRLFWLKTPFCFRCHHCSGNCYWQLDFKWTKTKLFVFIMHSKIQIWVELIRNLTFFKYPANIHTVSLRTFVEWILRWCKLSVTFQTISADSDQRVPCLQYVSCQKWTDYLCK